MASRLPRRFALVLLTVGVSGCGMLGDDGDAEVETPAQEVQGDSAAAATDPTTTLPSGQAVPPGQAGPSAAVGAAAPADSVTAVVQAADSMAILMARLDSIIAGQRAMDRRIDSLADATGGGAAASDPAAAPTAVLGEAGRSVRSFTVAAVVSVFVIILFNLLIRGAVWLLDTLAERNPRRRLFYKRLVPIIRIVLWIFAAYLIVRVIFRIDAQGLFAAAAAIGVAVGFAAQDLLKNLFGGLILVFDQPFQVGDKITVGETYGEVKSIGLRSTRIVTPDDNLVSVPNAQVVDQQVANANAGELNCQVVTDLYLPGWADEETAKRIAFDAATSSKYVYLSKPIAVLVADVFKETFLTRVRVKAYVLDPRFEFLFQSDITERARAGFRESGLLRPEHMRPYLVDHAVGRVPPTGPEDAPPEGERT